MLWIWLCTLHHITGCKKCQQFNSYSSHKSKHSSDDFSLITRVLLKRVPPLYYDSLIRHLKKVTLADFICSFMPFWQSGQ